MNRYLQGAIAGAVATTAHTAVMLVLHRLPGARRRATPPVQITAAVARRTGAASGARGMRIRVAAAVAHFGYGALAGTLYAAPRRRGRRRSALAGVAYGAGVWAASYLGWIPALRILPSAMREPRERNTMMVLAHVAWGAALALVFDRLRHDSPKSAPEERATDS